ncbi:pyruvate formate lyase family protein [Maledivibacter halophilus]|uniref:Pyruvate-formate lyase n=1 Tax=Maledivibacter halophilus TaxID=36842 RepID=A0A1T5KJ37_9FIRM|nr:pyruvate formate lyase family protein [Maledivibacter halophilus]SKC63683.1 Pyruvate-formate lyase [Maledivibacter halophilus]
MVIRELKKNDTNVAVAPKESLYMDELEQLKTMMEYTKLHSQYTDEQKLRREIECLKVLFPKVFRPMYEDDLILGRFDALPIGFGSVTSVGGPGHYCRFEKLDSLLEKLGVKYKKDIEYLKEYWKKNDTREVFYKEKLKENILGPFVDVLFPAIITARFSGMYLNYNLLLDNGIEGLKGLINFKREINPASKEEYDVMIEALNLLQDVIRHHIKEVETKLQNERLSPKRKVQMERLLEALRIIEKERPNSFVSAMQLAWLYSSMAGVVNYGRMDDYLGDYLAYDLKNNIITEEEAIDYIESQWRLIEVKRTNVNGRVIVGGRGRRNPKNADVFCKLAIEATKRAKLVEPQFTLRIYKGMDPKIYDRALDCIGEGITYPILYNDDVNIPAVMKTMGVDEKTAEQYVPFGCGEFVLSGQGVGTPNACINLLKALTIFIHDGIDQWDYKYKYGELKLKKMNDIKTFDEFFEEYKKLLTYYIELTAKAHAYSYKIMNKKVGFIYTSILIDDCIGRGKMTLDGGVKHLGGTNEMYGNMSTADSLAAIKKLVFDEKKYTLKEIQEILAKDFDDYKDVQQEMKNCPKFGNDDDYVDNIAVELHEFTCNEVAKQALKVGLDSWLVVVINNQVNTEWGRATASSPDGRIAGLYMSNANNPQSGADVNGPTAMLNSLTKIKADIHAGSVQNIKFSKEMFNKEREKIKMLFSTYFKKGGPQLMINVVGRDELEKAYKNPQAHKNLTVRVGGFSARFVNLEDDVQREIMARTCN